jgi:hypothetical protein
MNQKSALPAPTETPEKPVTDPAQSAPATPADSAQPSVTFTGDWDVTVGEQTNGRDALIGGVVLLVLAVVFFIVKNAYANWRVRERVAPSRANASGWFLFLGLMAVATIAVLGFVNSGRFLAPIYLVPLGGLAGVSLIAWLATFSAKR